MNSPRPKGRGINRMGVFFLAASGGEFDPQRLKFNLVGPLDGKTVVFDDTVNFLPFAPKEKQSSFVAGR